MTRGKAELVPPQACEAEEAVLGALLVAGGYGPAKSRELVDRVTAAGLTPGVFYRESHARIYRTILTLAGRGEPADAIVVIGELERGKELEDVGGRSRIHELIAVVPTMANAEAYVAEILDAWVRRSTIETAGEIAKLGWNGYDPGKVAELADNLRSLAGTPRRSSQLEPLDLAELLAGPAPAVEWLWHGWLARGDLALLVGDPGVGKSLLGLALANAVRKGRDLLGARCREGTAGIIDLENPAGEAHKRLRGAGVTSDDHDGLIYFHAPAINLSTDKGRHALADAAAGNELDLLIVDSLRRAVPGLDENDSKAVSAVLTPLRSLTATSGLAIVLVHHPRKRIGDNPTDAGQMVRGSLDLVASVDTLLYLRAKEAGSFTLEHAKSRRGIPHESILVTITETDDDRLELVNEGAIATADDKVEGMLSRIEHALRAEGRPLERQVLAIRVDTGPKGGTFSRALKLGWQRGTLAKNDREKPTDPQLYGLSEWAAE